MKLHSEKASLRYNSQFYFSARELLLIKRSLAISQRLISKAFDVLLPEKNVVGADRNLEVLLDNFTDRIKIIVQEFIESVSEEGSSQILRADNISLQKASSKSSKLLEMIISNRITSKCIKNTMPGNSYQQLFDNREYSSVEILKRAIQSRNKKLAAELLQRRREIEGEFLYKYEVTPLMLAIVLGDVDMVQELISVGLNLNHVVADSFDRLGKHFPSFQFKCKGNDSPDGYYSEKVSGGLTALVVATRLNHAEIVAKLLQSGADVDRLISYESANLNTFREKTKKIPFWMQTIFCYGYILDRQMSESFRLLLYSTTMINAKHEELGCTTLMLAAEEGRTQLVRELVGAGAALDVRHDHTSANALIYGSRNGHTDIVRILVDAGASLNCDSTFGTALVAACDKGHTPVVECLITAGASLEGFSKILDTTALIKAIENNWLGAVKVLIGAGASINSSTRQGNTPLMTAVTCGNLECLDMLLRGSELINCKHSNTGSTALMMASANGKTEVVAALLQAGALPDLQNTYTMETALTLAVRNQFIDTARLLVEEGASVDLCTPTHGTPLMAAIGASNFNIFCMLLSKGADVNVRWKGETPMMIAVKLGMINFVDELIHAGSELDALSSDSDALTALILAVQNGHVDIVQKLIQAGACVDVCSTKHGTALMKAISVGNLEVGRVLIENDADVNKEHPKSGLSPLMLAAQSGHLGFVQALLDAGGNVNDQQRCTEATALIYASNNGHSEVVARLVQLGALLDLESSFGSALEVAFAGGYDSIVDILLEGGASLDVRPSCSTNCCCKSQS